MTEQVAKARKIMSGVIETAKVFAAISVISAASLSVYQATVGGGIGKAARDNLGVTQLSDDLHALQAGQDLLAQKFDFLEANIDPFRVVNWEWNIQLGDCIPGSCFVRHFISRTPYGGNCGTPDSRAEIRIGNEISDLKLPEYSEVRATRRGVAVTVPLGVTRFMEPGDAHYRFINMYPDCTWEREPIPRYSPWFALTIAERSDGVRE